VGSLLDWESVETTQIYLAANLTQFPRKARLEATIAVVEEGFLAGVPPLRDVVRGADRNHASMAWDGRQLRTAWAAVPKLSPAFHLFY
jgi:hypothetical protein